jgi:hypothetical protein
MRRHHARCVFELLKPGQLAIWGSAAWAQTQLTPGVSTLAAPRPSIKRRLKIGARPYPVAA